MPAPFASPCVFEDGKDRMSGLGVVAQGAVVLAQRKPTESDASLGSL